MSIANLYMLSPVITPAGQINQIQSFEPDPGIETILHCGDGQVDYQFAAAMFQQPRLTFATTAIARALGLVGISGLAIAAATDFYFQKIAAGGTRTGGASSIKCTGTKGIIVPQTLEAEDKQPAVLTFALVLVSADGTTAPIAVTTGQTMPAITATDQMFVNGPVSINGATLDGIKSQRVDFGLDLVVEHGSGEAYPTFVGIRKRRPTISFRTTDVSFVGTAGITAQGATDSAVYFRKVDNRGTRVANATAEHIKITVDDGLITNRSIGGGNEEDVQMSEVLIEPTWDGTNDVLAISTASAIP